MVVVAQYHAVLQSLGLNTLEGVKRFQGDLVKDHHGQREIFRINAGRVGGRNLILSLGGGVSPGMPKANIHALGSVQGLPTGKVVW